VELRSIYLLFHDMANEKQPQKIILRGRLVAIEILGELGKQKSNTHFIQVCVDDEAKLKGLKPTSAALRWELTRDNHFWFHPSSTMKIEIYQSSRTRVRMLDRLVGLHTAKVVDLLENDATLDLEDKKGVKISACMKIKLSLAEQDDLVKFMEYIDSRVSHLDGNDALVAGAPVLGKALQWMKLIMDVVGHAHPALKVSWTVLSRVYEAVDAVGLQDGSIRDLADSLREMLGVAKELPDLLVISSTTNVIEGIGRASLEAASLIHEYTKTSFAGRALNTQLLDGMKSRIEECRKSCADLAQKLDRRVNIDANLQVKKIQGHLKIVKYEQLAAKIREWLAAPGSSKNYNAAREQRQENTGSWFLSDARYHEWLEKVDLLWIKGIPGSGKTILR